MTIPCRLLGGSLLLIDSTVSQAVMANTMANSMGPDAFSKISELLGKGKKGGGKLDINGMLEHQKASESRKIEQTEERIEAAQHQDGNGPNGVPLRDLVTDDKAVQAFVDSCNADEEIMSLTGGVEVTERQGKIMMELRGKGYTELQHLQSEFNAEYVAARAKGLLNGFDFAKADAIQIEVARLERRMNPIVKVGHVGMDLSKYAIDVVAAVVGIAGMLVMPLTFPKMVGMQGGIIESWSRFLQIGDYQITTDGNGVAHWDLANGAQGAGDLHDICGNFVDMYKWNILDPNEQTMYKDNGMWGAPCLSKWIWDPYSSAPPRWMDNRFAGCILGTSAEAAWDKVKRKVVNYDPIANKDEDFHFFNISRQNYDCHGNVVTYNAEVDQIISNFKETTYQDGFYLESSDSTRQITQDCVNGRGQCLGIARKPKACQWEDGFQAKARNGIGNFPMDIVQMCYEPLSDYMVWRMLLTRGQFAHCKNEGCADWTAGAVPFIPTQRGPQITREPSFYSDAFLPVESKKFFSDPTKIKFPSDHILETIVKDIVQATDDIPIKLKMLKCSVYRDYLPWKQRPAIKSDLVNIDPNQSVPIPRETTLKGYDPKKDAGKTIADLPDISQDELVSDYSLFLPYIFQPPTTNCNLQDWVDFLNSDPAANAASIRVPIFKLLSEDDDDADADADADADSTPAKKKKALTPDASADDDSSLAALLGGGSGGDDDSGLGGLFGSLFGGDGKGDGKGNGKGKGKGKKGDSSMDWLLDGNDPPSDDQVDDFISNLMKGYEGDGTGDGDADASSDETDDNKDEDSAAKTKDKSSPHHKKKKKKKVPPKSTSEDPSPTPSPKKDDGDTDDAPKKTKSSSDQKASDKPTSDSKFADPADSADLESLFTSFDSAGDASSDGATTKTAKTTKDSSKDAGDSKQAA